MQQEAIDILLVDDEARNLDALEAILEDPAYRLFRAQTADDALKRLLERDVAVIVLDVKMPGVSGFELAETIKGSKKFRQIPIIFLTAYLLEDDFVLQGYVAGGVDYLTKPVNPRILRHKVAAYADLFQKTRALAELNEQLEARVRERTAQLERTSRMKDEFLATVSHELRTPLNAILGWASMLTRQLGDPAKVSHGIEVIERNARAQARLVEDLLDVSGIISGKLRLRTSSVSPAKVVHAAVDAVRPAADAKRIVLTADLDPGLGPVMGDADRLQQAVWNLLSNAVRFTPAGGHVTVKGECASGSIVLSVHDDGRGIPPEHLPYVFERFRQVDSSTTRSYGGLGLGLAIVRHLVEAHGGSVEARSEGADKGATFVITLPLASAERSASASPESRANGSGEPRAAPKSLPVVLRNVRALVVDDDLDSVELLCAVLEDAGAQATGARSAREALDVRGDFDVVISDVGMPEMDGYSFVRALRSRGRTAPAIALTAYARSEDAQKAISAGFQRHIAKPVDPDELVEAVKSLLARP